MVAKALFWSSLGALAWTHAGYPLAVAALARVRSEARPQARHRAHRQLHRCGARRGGRDRAAAREPARARLPGREARDRGGVRCTRPTARTSSSRPSPPASRASASSSARAEGRSRRRTARCVRPAATILAFSDANTLWRPDALRELVRNFADSDVAYVCGSHFYEHTDGTNREGVYARFEGWLRRERVAARIDHRRRRADLRRSPRRTTSRSILVSATTSPCRTCWCSEAAVPSSSRRRSAGRSPRATSWTSTGGRSACSSTAG